MFALVAWLAAVGPVLPEGITPIAELGALPELRHAEVLQVERDFGRPNVNVAVDVWMPDGDTPRIDAVRLWWSDEIDRFPFSAAVLEQLDIDVQRREPSSWRVEIAADGKRFGFDVTLDHGQPAAFGDVVLDDGRVVRHCRAESALLSARRFLGIPIGLRAIVVACTAPDGARHVAPLRTEPLGRRRGRGR